MIGYKMNKWNPLKFFKRSEMVRVILWGKGGRQIRQGSLIKDGDFVRDPATDLTYGPTRIRPLMDRQGNASYNLHMESAAPLEVGEIDIETHVIDPRDGWSATTIFDQDGNEIWMFDAESRRPARIEFDESVIKMKTDPELMSVLTSKTMLANALNRQQAISMLLLVAVAAFFMGWVVGGSMA